MKTLILYVALLISGSCLAQLGINYKAVVRDDFGNILANQTIDVEFTIIKNVGIFEVYKELHEDIMTDSNGIIVLVIGAGASSIGAYVLIDWSNDSYFLKTQIDIGSGLVDMGTIGFKEVPFAATAKDISDAPSRTLEVAGTGQQKIRINSIDNGIPALEFMGTGARTDWKIQNSNAWLDFLTSDDDFANTDIKFSFHEDGKLGINNSNPVEELHVTGTIRSTDLAGTGTRNIVASSNGNLILDTGVKYISVSPAAFVPSSDGKNPIIFTSFLSAEGPSGTPQSATFVAPLNLPQGATITNFKFYFIDNVSSNGMTAALISNLHTSNVGGTFDGLVSNSLGPSSSIQSLETNSLTIGTIDNTLYSYGIQLNSSGWLPGIMAFTGILINYTLP